MSAEFNRDEILRRFEQWLDRALASEEPPAGIDAEILAALGEGSETGDGELERRCDSHALWSAVTALAQEVKLQGRAFKELSGALDTQAGRIAGDLRAEHGERERDLERQVERRCRKEALGALIDLRDCLGRGIESVRAGNAELARSARGGWLSRVSGRARRERTAAALEALAKGYELTLERLDHTLNELRAAEIRCLGEPFDPRRMNAIDRQETDAVAEGTVIEVYRSGYEWNGELFRPAQVKVACAPSMRGPFGEGWK